MVYSASRVTPYECAVRPFWSQAKWVLRKYNSIPKNTFLLFLKECEFRFKYGTQKKLKKLKERAEI
jgi:transposase